MYQLFTNALYDLEHRFTVGRDTVVEEKNEEKLGLTESAMKLGRLSTGRIIKKGGGAQSNASIAPTDSSTDNKQKRGSDASVIYDGNTDFGNGYFLGQKSNMNFFGEQPSSTAVMAREFQPAQLKSLCCCRSPPRAPSAPSTSSSKKIINSLLLFFSLFVLPFSLSFSFLSFLYFFLFLLQNL